MLERAVYNNTDTELDAGQGSSNWTYEMILHVYIEQITFQFWHPSCNEIDIFHWDKQHLVRNSRYLRLKSI